MTDWKLVREIYIALYAMNLAELGLDRHSIAKCVLWDGKSRPDMICRITGRPLYTEEHIQECFQNLAIEEAKGTEP